MSDAPSSKQGTAAPATLLQEEGMGDRPIDHVNIRNEPPAGVSDPHGGTGGRHEHHHSHHHKEQQHSTLSSDQGRGQDTTDFAGGQGQREGLGQDTTMSSDRRQQGLGQDTTTTHSSNQGQGQTQGQGLGEGLGQGQTRDREPSHFQAAPGMPATGRKDLIKVPVHVDSHLAEMSDEDIQDDKGGALKKVAGALGKVKKLRGDKDTAIGKVITLEMTREDYNKYWVRDQEGNYAGTEPEGEGRRLWADELKGAKST